MNFIELNRRVVTVLGAILSISCCAIPNQAAEPAQSEKPPVAAAKLLNSQCLDCHSGSEAEAGLDLTELSAQLDQPANFHRWVRIHDRVKAGEMPPASYGELPADEKAEFLSQTGAWLSQVQKQQNAELGRVRGRRLTNKQLERTLHDLLGIDIPLARYLTEDQKTEGFTTVADGQAMSHFQLQKHLQVVDRALEEAFQRALIPEKAWSKDLSAEKLCRTRPKSRTREPELLDGLAVTWSSRLMFYGRLPSTTSQQDGWYRIVVKASALKSPEDHGVWCTVRSGKCLSNAPLLEWIGSFEATEEPQEWTFETWLPRGDMLEIRPGDTTLKMGRFANGQVGAGEGGPQDVPGVALHSLRMERIHYSPEMETIRQGLIGDLSYKKADKWDQCELRSENPRAALKQLMHNFATRAFRSPVDEQTLAPYLALAEQELDAGQPLLQALLGGYRALLCSPRFLYFQENVGPLDDYAIASRLSYMLWSTMPDAQLLQLAAAGELKKPHVLEQQFERMLADERGQKFIEDFAAEWLDLNQIDSTEPSPKLYPTFDILVQQAMLDETHAFLQKMLQEDLSVGHLIDADYTFLNSRLARYYGVKQQVKGDELRLVQLEKEEQRGGVLTQGAILKVTANGTDSSPVVRGVWVSERLLGVHIPPAPPGIPAIEPDIRGAKTIRQILEKHRADDSCAGCHRLIDPAGFALENFDAAGLWRSHYTKVEKNKRKKGLEVDPSYELVDGRPFKDLQEFQQLILTDREIIARNVVEKFLLYGTGGTISFTDREIVAEVARSSASTDYGFRSLLRGVVTSPLFLTK